MPAKTAAQPSSSVSKSGTSKAERKAAWDAARAEVLEAIDVQAEYIAWGAKLAGEPNEDGWVACYSLGRQDSNASAGINVGVGVMRGRYRDFGDTSADSSLSFFYAAARFGGHADHKAALKHYATVAGVTLPATEDSTDWESQIEFQKWIPNLCHLYTQAKQPITADALERMGARRGKWPKKSTEPDSVFALPVYGPNLLNSDPSGWVVIHAYGKPLNVYDGPEKPLKQEKSHTLRGTRGGLMNRFALEHLATAEVIWKVEGVSDCLTLESIIPEELRGRHVVVTNSGGASEKPRAEFAALFAGKDVRVIHDADHAGQAGAAVWVSVLAEAGANVRRVDLPYLIAEKHGLDLRDWIGTDKHSYTDLLELADKFEPVTKKSNSNDGDKEDMAERAICDLIHLDVLGEHEDGRIRVYSKARKKVVTIKDVSHMQFPQLIQICGSPARDHVTEKSEEEGKWPLKDVRESIALIAGKRRIEDGSMLGQGVWPIDGHAVCVVNGGAAAVWNGSRELEPNESPICRGHLLDLNNTEPWVDFDRLRDYLHQATHKEFCVATINSALEVFARWKWRNQDTDPALIVGLIMATYCQVFFDWRPQVALLGESGTGKTTLFQFLGRLFGKLAMSGEKPTEAGLRQAVGNSSRAILLDEFEHDQHRQKVLELIRTASRGESSAILRGSQDQKGKRFSLRHICWVAAIEIGLRRDPDRNRFVQLELIKPPDEEQGKLTLPTAGDAHDLGLRLLAVAIENVWRARDMAAELRGRYGSTPDRVVESYSVPTAMMAVSSGMLAAYARAWLGGVLNAGEFEETMMSDQDELLDAILSADVWVDRGKETVGRILAGETAEKPGAVTSLEASGITRVTVQGDKSRRDVSPWMSRGIIFISHRAVAQKLLRGTKWEDQSLDQLLLRVKGAKRGQRKISGRISRGIEIPASAFGLIEEEY